jgi:hypothetical protein
MGGEGNGTVVTLKPAYVFDVTQTEEHTPRAASRSAGRPARRAGHMGLPREVPS